MKSSYSIDLTLTNVVFEFVYLFQQWIKCTNLTLTNVVFELICFDESDKEFLDLTLTNVVFEFPIHVINNFNSY